MPKVRRTPKQNLFTVMVILIGIWIGTSIVSGEFRSKRDVMEIQQRPNLHLRGATAEELEAARFKGATEFPWSDIYLRLFQDANGDLIRVMRCDIPAEAVGFLIKREPGIRRPTAQTPPPWWPWDRQREEGKPRSAFRVPDWFEPVGDSVFFTERRVPGSDIAWEGIYVSYDDEAGRLWLWQWRRNDWQPPQTERITVEPLDALAQGFGSRLIAVRHPVAEGGWLRQPGQDIVRSGVPAEVFPAGVTRVDLCLRPQAEGNADHDFLMRLHGVEEADLPLLLRDHPLRALPANAKPPLAAWAFARPEQLPQWFRAGTGPRWATAVVMPGQNSVHGGRWVAYDRGQKQLLVWDWGRDAGKTLAADIVRGKAMPEWPTSLWALPVYISN
jgi:hypothetical protein